MTDDREREMMLEDGVLLYLEDEGFDPAHTQKVRIRAVILLAVFLLPSILIAIEVITGGLSRGWEELIKPFLNDPRILYF